MRSPTPSPRRWRPGLPRRAGESRGLAGDRGAAAHDRRGAKAAGHGGGCGGARSDRRGPKEAAEAAASIPDRRLALMFACAHPAIEESIRAPLMLQTILRLRRGGDRLRLPGFARRDGPAPRPARRRKSAWPAYRSGSPSLRTCPSGSGSRSKRSTPRSRTAGRRLSRTTRAGAISPRRLSGLAASSSPSRRRSRKRWGSWR